MIDFIFIGAADDTAFSWMGALNSFESDVTAN